MNNRHACLNCQKEVADESRLIKGKCFHCTYLQQLQKTKRVIQQHTLPRSKQSLTRHSDIQRCSSIKQNIFDHSINNSLAASRGHDVEDGSNTPGRVSQTADCIRCYRKARLTELVRGVCDRCLTGSPYRTAEPQWKSSDTRNPSFLESKKESSFYNHRKYESPLRNSDLLKHSPNVIRRERQGQDLSTQRIGFGHFPISHDARKKSIEDYAQRRKQPIQHVQHVKHQKHNYYYPPQIADPHHSQDLQHRIYEQEGRVQHYDPCSYYRGGMKNRYKFMGR